MKGRNTKSPVRRSKTEVTDRVQIPPNYDAKRQTGMESSQPAKAPMGKGKRPVC